VLAGWLYDTSLTALVVVVALAQAVALVLLVRTFRSGLLGTPGDQGETFFENHLE
jgi:hypothetical protein